MDGPWDRLQPRPVRAPELRKCRTRADALRGPVALVPRDDFDGGVARAGEVRRESSRALYEHRVRRREVLAALLVRSSPEPLEVDRRRAEPGTRERCPRDRDGELRRAATGRR